MGFGDLHRNPAAFAAERGQPLERLTAQIVRPLVRRNKIDIP